MSKYYTPSLEEFHIGFEYELQGGLQSGIIKYEPNDDCLIGDVLYWISKGTVRVKYLDKEDIESLGWVESTYKGIKCYTRDNRILHWFGRPYLDISYYPLFEGQGPARTFRGTIKNKSELKVLMKQLGINE